MVLSNDFKNQMLCVKMHRYVRSMIDVTCKDAQTCQIDVAGMSNVLLLSLKLMDAFSSSRLQVALQFPACKSHCRTVSVSPFFSMYEVKIIVTIPAQYSYKLC